MNERELEKLEKELQDGWIKDEPYVFVSYASKNKDKVFETILELRKRGINVYVDVELQENISSNWLENIKNRLFESDCRGMISFVSIDFMRSYACMIEQLLVTSNSMLKKKGKVLPNFYISLDEQMGSPQGIRSVIYGTATVKESEKMEVRMVPEERTFLFNEINQNKSICDKHYKSESVLNNELDGLRSKHDIATTMYSYFFEENSVSIQQYKSASACAELLSKNFTNDKNTSIHLEKLKVLQEKYGTVKDSDKNNSKNLSANLREDCVEEKNKGKERNVCISNKDISSKINQICKVIEKMKEEELPIQDYTKTLQKVYGDVAKELNIGKSSVVDKCQRQLNLSAMEFGKYVKEFLESESDTLYKIVYGVAKSQSEKDMVDQIFAR